MLKKLMILYLGGALKRMKVNEGMISIINNMYKKNKICVKVEKQLSEPINITIV